MGQASSRRSGAACGGRQRRPCWQQRGSYAAWGGALSQAPCLPTLPHQASAGLVGTSQRNPRRQFYNGLVRSAVPAEERPLVGGIPWRRGLPVMFVHRSHPEAAARTGGALRAAAGGAGGGGGAAEGRAEGGKSYEVSRVPACL